MMIENRVSHLRVGIVVGIVAAGGVLYYLWHPSWVSSPEIRIERDLPAGVPVTIDRTESKRPISAALLVPVGKRGVTISLSSLPDWITEGVGVDIVATSSVVNNETSHSLIIAEDALVLSHNQGDSAELSSKARKADSVTLAVKPEEALRVVSARENSILSLVSHQK